MKKHALFTAIIALFLFANTSHAVDQDAVDNLTSALAAQFEYLVPKQVRKALRESGMAETDVQRALVELSDQGAKCLVGAIIKQATDQSLDVDKVLRELDAALHNNGDLSDGLDEDEMERSLEYCLLLAFESAGVDIPFSMQ